MREDVKSVDDIESDKSEFTPVWVVIAQEFEDCWVIGLCSSLEKAQKVQYTYQRRYDRGRKRHVDVSVEQHDLDIEYEE